MVQSLSAEFAKRNDAVSSSPTLAGLLVKAGRGEPLSEEELWQPKALMNRNLNTFLAAQKAYESGQLDKDYFETICDDVRRMSKSPGWADAFRELVDNFPNERDKDDFRGFYDDEAKN